MKKEIKFIDLFAGIGGIRKGFELACAEVGYETKCVFTSEIKPYAIDVLNQNHPQEIVHGDITKVDEKDMPEFDFLLAGFPCQAFSAAGKRLGFLDTRGTLFFDVERILKEKEPFGFVLENVEGLVNHDRENPKDEIGRTLSTILRHLDDLGYHVNWKVLNAKNFEVPQDRKRIYIVGTKKEKPSLDNFAIKHKKLGNVLEVLDFSLKVWYCVALKEVQHNAQNDIRPVVRQHKPMRSNAEEGLAHGRTGRTDRRNARRPVRTAERRGKSALRAVRRRYRRDVRTVREGCLRQRFHTRREDHHRGTDRSKITQIEESQTHSDSSYFCEVSDLNHYGWAFCPVIDSRMQMPLN